MRRDSANQNGQDDWMDDIVNMPAEEHHIMDVSQALPHEFSTFPPSGHGSSIYAQDVAALNSTILPNDHEIDMFMMNNDMAAWNDVQQHWNLSMCEPDHCCLNTALDLLRRLSITEASKACPRRGMPEQTLPPTLEMAASMNRNIISSLNTILECSCSLNGNLLTIISLVTFKVSTLLARHGHVMLTDTP